MISYIISYSITFQLPGAWNEIEQKPLIFVNYQVRACTNLQCFDSHHCFAKFISKNKNQTLRICNCSWCSCILKLASVLQACTYSGTFSYKSGYPSIYPITFNWLHAFSRHSKRHWLSFLIFKFIISFPPSPFSVPDLQVKPHPTQKASSLIFAFKFKI